MWGVSTASGADNVQQQVTLMEASNLLTASLVASSIALTMF
jgi:hypothetical protein